MPLIECRHREKQEITTVGEARRKFMCVDCSEVTLGTDPAACAHETLRRVEAASMSIGGNSVVHQWSNRWMCDECWTLLAFGEPEMTAAGLAFYGITPPSAPRA